MRLLRALAVVLCGLALVAATAATAPRPGAVTAPRPRADSALRVGVVHPFPDRVDLPDGFAPEGITAGRGRTLFAGSLLTGEIRRVNVRTGVSSVVVAGSEGRVAVGVDYDRRTDTLWVAGGRAGTVAAYDGGTGRVVAAYDVAGDRFLNDVAVTRRAIYVTDSIRQELVVVPLRPDGRPAANARILPLTGEIEFLPGADTPDANGIVSLRAGRWLLVVQSNTGQLFRVDARTGVATEVDVGGATLTYGDGMERKGRTLWVVRNRLNEVAVLRLRDGGLRARLVSAVSAADLDVPTTAALVAHRLWVVNARFGREVTPDTAYWITQLPRR